MRIRFVEQIKLHGTLGCAMNFKRCLVPPSFLLGLQPMFLLRPQPAFLINIVWQTRWLEQCPSRATSSCSAAPPHIFWNTFSPRATQCSSKSFEVLNITICEEEDRHDSCLIRLSLYIINTVRNKFPLSPTPLWTHYAQLRYLHLFQSHNGHAAFRHSPWSLHSR